MADTLGVSDRVFLYSRWLGLSGLILIWMTACEVKTSAPVPTAIDPVQASQKDSSGEALVPTRRSGGMPLGTEPYEGPPEILSIWSSFMVHPDRRILPELSREWFQTQCAKIKLSSADEGIGHPIYVGWDGRLENRAAGKISIYIDSLTLDEAPELVIAKPIENTTLQKLLDRPVPEQPAITLEGNQSCAYFYSRDAAYRFYVRGLDGQGNESPIVGPIVASIFQLIQAQDLTSAVTQDMSISSTSPEVPDQLKLRWVPVQVALPELYDPKNSENALILTTEYHKVLRGLEYLIHLYVDDQGIGKTLSIPHYVTETEVAYKDVVPFDYFTFIRGKSDGSASGRHKLLTYRYNDACEFSVENAKVEACRRSDYIVLYPQYMDHDDDFRRGVILVHESSHKSKKEGGVGPHSCGRGGDVGPGSYTAGISVLRRVIEHSKNCFERASAYQQMVAICSLNVVSSREFYQRHCHSGTCDSEWANQLKDPLGCIDMDRMANPDGECFPGRNSIVAPDVCEISVQGLVE